MRDIARVFSSPLCFEAIESLVEARFAPPAAALCMRQAFEMAMEKSIDSVLLAPMNKEAFHRAGYAHFDELAYLAKLTKSTETN